MSTTSFVEQLRRISKCANRLVLEMDGQANAARRGKEREGKTEAMGSVRARVLLPNPPPGPKARENVIKGISLGCGESLSGAFVVVLSSQRIRNSGRVSKGESRKDMPREALER
jgi:hypothetical protein